MLQPMAAVRFAYGTHMSMKELVVVSKKNDEDNESTRDIEFSRTTSKRKVD